MAYDCEARTIRKQDEVRIIADEMRFMRGTAGYTIWEYKKKKWKDLEEVRLKYVDRRTKRKLEEPCLSEGVASVS